MSIKRYRVLRAVFMMALTTMVFSACTDKAAEEEDNTDYDLQEQQVFDEWIKVNRADLVGSRQSEGYYLEFTDDSAPVAGEGVKQGEYVRYNITSYDLAGNVCNQRSEELAVQLGTYNRYTRYVPKTSYIPLMSDYSEAISDGKEVVFSALQSAFMADELMIDGTLMEVGFEAGTKFNLYMPSLLAGDANGVGGYAGQHTHSGYKPLVSTVEIVEVINDQEQYEKDQIDQFIAYNDTTYPSADWEQLSDEGAHYIRLNRSYVPTETKMLQFENQYPYTKLFFDNSLKIDGEPTTNADMQLAINRALVERFEIEESERPIGDGATCHVWYITRTLDGFIVDTNIAELQSIIYGTTTANTSSLIYDTEAENSNYISSWHYVLPKLKYGQWAAFVTTSQNAYKEKGAVGSSTATEIPPYTPLLFEVFVDTIYDDSYYL